jgi:glucosamine--fructose-6-phosphate aminotransferase (isomerizing)
MCGIVGAAASRPVASLLLDGLKRLEYRGYDSAGIAVVNQEQQLERLRVLGKVRELETALQNHPLLAHTGIAHTRWATHGAPSEMNAHPFVSNQQFALVHNGIIENHAELRQRLQRANYTFASETDSETAVHLIHYHFTQTNDFLKAVRAAVSELEGAYALGVICVDFPGRVIGVRQGAPLVVGRGQGENYLASDPLAMLSLTKDFTYLEDNDIVDITVDGFEVYDKNHQKTQRELHTLSLQQDAVERGEYRHYMMKEIMEQPEAMGACLEGRVSNDHVLPGIFGPQSAATFAEMRHIRLIACGTSYHAAMVARYWFETLTDIPCSVEVASEFRYRNVARIDKTLFVTLSQSGETADTLAALRLAKSIGYHTLTICNVPGSTMLRESDMSFLTRAGVEIGVASTKAFITQLTALFLLGLSIRQAKNMTDAYDVELVQQLLRIPAQIEEVLKQDQAVMQWAKTFTDKQHAIFLGRGAMYPIALEGALKMKEISYIHAEGYPAGELKHGPLALVDNNMPVIAGVPGDALTEKTLSNLQEVRARGGKLYILTDRAALIKQDAFTDAHIITMPSVQSLLAPILYTVPLQLLAYHVAVLKGTDVDQPRNLAKSVTVE